MTLARPGSIRPYATLLAVVSALPVLSTQARDQTLCLIASPVRRANSARKVLYRASRAQKAHSRTTLDRQLVRSVAEELSTEKRAA